jgi:hypothetical protein
MISHSPEQGNTPMDDIRDAAWNAVATASIHWQQSVNALRHILVTAADHGLTMDELVVASGIQRSNIIRVLADGRDL